MDHFRDHSDGEHGCLNMRFSLDVAKQKLLEEMLELGGVTLTAIIERDISLNQNCLSLFEAHCPNLTELRYFVSPSSGFIPLIHSLSDQLTSLNADGKLEERDAIALSVYCLGLVKLEIPVPEFNMDDCFFSVGPKLQHLGLHSLFSPPKIFPTVKKHCRSLVSLKIIGCEG